MPKMDYSKLLGRMAEKGFTRQSLAEAIGSNNSYLGAKLKSKRLFSQTEIEAISNVLDIDLKDIGMYFFCRKS